MIAVPDDLRRTAESLGPAGHAWLAALPEVVGELATAWSLSLGEALTGGKWSYVARARSSGGTEAVLKVALPTPAFAQQAAILDAAAGRGYVRLYDSDPARCALLMEPLGQRLSLAGGPIENILDALATTLREAWQIPNPATQAAGFDKATESARFLDDSPQAPRHLIAVARTLAEERASAFDPGTAVFCHGDPHADNALAVTGDGPRPGADSGYVFVDPDGFRCEAAYDLGVTMRGWTEHVLDADDPVALTHGWSTRLAQATGVDEQAIWDWALLERITSGLYLTRHGHPALGRAFLASADRLV